MAIKCNSKSDFFFILCKVLCDFFKSILVGKTSPFVCVFLTAVPLTALGQDTSTHRVKSES